jgi:hypothetical protein
MKFFPLTVALILCFGAPALASWKPPNPGQCTTESCNATAGGR